MLLRSAFYLATIPVARAAMPSTWLVIMRSTSTKAGSLQSAIAPLGGSIVAAYPETGAFVVAADGGFRTAAAGLPGVSSIVWDAGFTGAGVRVAVLDGNFDVTHPDLAPNIDPALPRSFVPGEPIAPPPDATTSHGTLVAGIIGATANG